MKNYGMFHRFMCLHLEHKLVIPNLINPLQFTNNPTTEKLLSQETSKRTFLSIHLLFYGDLLLLNV